MKSKKKLIGSVVILLILAAFLVVGLFLKRPKVHDLNEEDIFVESTSKTSVAQSDAKLVTVYINGEVKSPGVYKLRSGSIIEDLIKAAGGYTESADLNNKLNLAKKLKDEDYYYVEKKAEASGLTANAGTAIKVPNGNDKINLNNATLEELDKIPGVGPATAQKIIDYREKNGAFGSLEDLKKVGGIGDKTINNFRDKVDIR